MDMDRDIIMAVVPSSTPPSPPLELLLLFPFPFPLPLLLSPLGEGDIVMLVWTGVGGGVGRLVLVKPVGGVGVGRGVLALGDWDGGRLGSIDVEGKGDGRVLGTCDG